jgi:hypothetical protein
VSSQYTIHYTTVLILHEWLQQRQRVQEHIEVPDAKELQRTAPERELPHVPRLDLEREAKVWDGDALYRYVGEEGGGVGEREVQGGRDRGGGGGEWS